MKKIWNDPEHWAWSALVGFVLIFTASLAIYLMSNYHCQSSGLLDALMGHCEPVFPDDF